MALLSTTSAVLLLAHSVAAALSCLNDYGEGHAVWCSDVCCAMYGTREHQKGAGDACLDPPYEQ